jgi:hypothetical protein
MLIERLRIIKHARTSTILTFISVWLLINLASLGCQFFTYLQQGNPSGVLFQDDFSNPSSGWQQIESSEGSLVYVDEGYRISVNQPHTQVWSTPALNFTDSRVEVLASKVAGEDDNIFGIICRSKVESQFYAFVISSDGYYGIASTQGGRFEFLEKDGMSPSEVIVQGNHANHLRADCVGSTLGLYANGVKIPEVQDSTFTSGEVGLIAGTQGSPGTVIQFDNFQVLRP